jgi:hypothetical protein
MKSFLYKQVELFFHKINTSNDSAINSSLILAILIVTNIKYSTEEQFIWKCLVEVVYDNCSDDVREFRNFCQTVAINCSTMVENSSYFRAVESLWLP